MRSVEFYKGTIRNSQGENELAYWAVAPFGFRCYLPSSGKVSSSREPMAALSSELITVLDLSGTDEDSAEFITDTILKGGFLDKPGVKGRGEAVLFMLVNEALQRLAEIQAELLAQP